MRKSLLAGPDRGDWGTSGGERPLWKSKKCPQYISSFQVSCAAKSSSLGVETDLSSNENEVMLQVERVPREVVKANDRFWGCCKCGKVYWQGSHWDRAQANIIGRANKLLVE